MLSKADFFLRTVQRGLPLAAISLAAALAACGGPAQAPRAARAADATASDEAVLNVPMAIAQPASPASAAEARPDPGAAPAAPAPDASAGNVVLRLLAYADRLRGVPAAQLGQEAARLGTAPTPLEQMQLALVLSHYRQTPELIRAQELLTRVINNPDALARPLHPLARLLAFRFGEQRRIEDLLDRQSQQTRDAQRRLDQTHERLEALKAIERSMTSRSQAPGAAAAQAAPVPSRRGRAVAP